MPKKKCAMVIMNELFNPSTDFARIDTEKVENHIMTVQNPQQAIELARSLKEQGFGAIEVCGAFGEELARQMYQATDCMIPVGYVVTPADQIKQAIAFWEEKE